MLSSMKLEMPAEIECGDHLTGGQSVEEDEEEEEGGRGDAISALLKENGNSGSVSANLNLRKRKHKFHSSLISREAKEAQRLEKERLERIEKNKKELNAADYAPIKISPSSSTNLDDQTFDELIQLEDDDDDIEEVGFTNKAEVDFIELGSSEDEVEVGQPSTSANPYGHPSLRFNGFANLREQFRVRRRRRSIDYDKTEKSADGRLLINAGKPESDPDVFVAEHLTNVLQPHQIGGVKFMYDNIIESLDSFHKSSGFGCILAHSMGLGKSIQAITFLEIFIRVTGQKRVLIICPVNVLQNWHNEFNRWMPIIDVETAQPIRHFELFVLGDSVKTLESRAQLLDKWNQSGGVLLMGYEMFRLLAHQCELSGEKGSQRKKASKKQTLRTVLDLADGLDKIDDQGRAQIVQKDELQKTIRQALLSPGPDLVICDEGHRIKNLNTEVSYALSSINTKRRIVLTGYPIQNNLMEYFCMVEFVRPSYLGSRKDFQLMFDKPIRNGLCKDSTKRDIKLAKQRTHVLCDMLRGFVQRRSQHLLKKILPESREFIVLLRKSELQHSLYRAFHHYACDQITVGETSFNPLKAFAICMKIVNHPDMLHAALKKHQLKCQSKTNGGSEESNNRTDPWNNRTDPCQSSTSVQYPSDGPTAVTHSPLKANNNTFLNDHRPFEVQQSKNPSPPMVHHQQHSFVTEPPSTSLNGGQCFDTAGHQWHSQFFAPPVQIQQQFQQNRPPLHYPQQQHTFGQQHYEQPQLQQQYTFFQQPPPYQPNSAYQCYLQQQQQGQFNSQFFPPPTQPAPYRHQFFTMDYDNSSFGGQPPRWYSSNSGVVNNNNNGTMPNPYPQEQQFFNTYPIQPTKTQTKQEVMTEPHEQYNQQQLQQFGIEPPVEELPCVNEKGSQKNGGERPPKPMTKKKQQHIVRGEEFYPLSDDEFLFESGNSIDLEWAEPLLSDYVTGLVEHSSKMFVAMAIISETIRRGEKLLLFSQSVVTINLIEQFLLKYSGEPIGPDDEPVKFVRNETYCRLDGSTSGSDREKLINKFNQNANLRLFLISTRAGGLGVNLVSANRVIIFDVSWNPVHDAQAVCRIYRYGQRRRTYIYRLIMSNCMEKQVFNRQLSKSGLQKRVVDEQLIEANVTTKEVEDLMAYDEALDVLLAGNRFEKEAAERAEQLDDDLLKMLIRNFPHKFFELPFLHESMMLEQEADLSAEEKLEAQLLYEREKRGINFPLQPPNGGNQPMPSGINLPFPPMLDYYQQQQIASNRQRFLQNFGNPFAATTFQRPWHSTPLPKRIELASAVNQQQRKQLQPTPSPVITIREQLTLPKVIPSDGAPTQHTLKVGDQITMFRSECGVYFRTMDGIILDATDTHYGKALMQQAKNHSLSFVRRPPQPHDPNEIIQIDD